MPKQEPDVFRHNSFPNGKRAGGNFKYWFLAARPKTLAAALIPVVTAISLAYAEERFNWQPALICILFAIIMQIAANYINDLFDFLKGSDGTDRLGPKRACAQGWISPHAMKRGIAVTLVLACGVGCCLLPYGGWPLVIVGASCVVFAFLYTTLLSYMGCGDILVLLFFGFVPVCGTYYVQALALSPSVWWLAAGCGLVTDTLLVLNNYRDREQDAANGKRTLIVVMGERRGALFYLFLGICGYLCVAVLAFYGHTWAAILPALYLIPHSITWKKMVKIHHGRDLNVILGETSRNMLLFAILTAIALSI